MAQKCSRMEFLALLRLQFLACRLAELKCQRTASQTELKDMRKEWKRMCVRLPGCSVKELEGVEVRAVAATQERPLEVQAVEALRLPAVGEANLASKETLRSCKERKMPSAASARRAWRLMRYWARRKRS